MNKRIRRKYMKQHMAAAKNWALMGASCIKMAETLKATAAVSKNLHQNFEAMAVRHFNHCTGELAMAFAYSH